MPSAANIVLADSTPTNHTFVPVQVSPSLTIHVESGVAITPSGDLSFTSSLDLANVKRPTDRVKLQFNFPVEQTTDGVTTVAYVGRVFVDAAIPVQMTAAQRADLAAYASNLMANAVIQGYFSRLPQY